MGSFYSKLLSDMFSSFTTHVSVLQRKLITINTSSATDIKTDNDVTTDNDIANNSTSTGYNVTMQVKPLMISKVLKSNVGADARPSIYIQIWNF